MPSDALTYALCASELSSTLASGRINKITMPHPDTLILWMRAQGKNLNLVLSANASFPRIHFSKMTMPSPEVAPSFLMHLRKHIGGGVIEEVAANAFERVVTIKIRAYNELMIPESKKLIIEIMGKHSNIILLNEKGIISDSIKHITADISGKRQVMPGLPYHLPPVQEGKINVSNVDKLKELLTNFESGSLQKFLQNALSGLASSSIKEAIFRAKIDCEAESRTLNPQNINKIIMALQSMYDYKNAKPCALRVGNAYTDFFVSPYYSMLGAQENSDPKEPTFETFVSLNDAMDAYYTSVFTRQVSIDKRAFLLTVIKNAQNKAQKKLGLLLQKQHDARDYEEYRKKADLILSNLYRIRKGDSQIEVENFFDDNKPIRISIDAHKTPQANAQVFYKTYNKKKATLTHLAPFVEELTSEIEYLDNLAYFAESASEDDEFFEVSSELIRLGYLKRKVTHKKNTPPKKLDSFRIFSYGGHRILVGKSSVSNDALVKKSTPESVWLHASSIHGSHVVIENQTDNMPADSVLLYAAQLAAYYSKARQSENVPVDYTFIKNVKKPKSSLPGKVIFTNQKTLYVTPKNPE